MSVNSCGASGCCKWTLLSGSSSGALAQSFAEHRMDHVPGQNAVRRWVK